RRPLGDAERRRRERAVHRTPGREAEPQPVIGGGVLHADAHVDARNARRHPRLVRHHDVDARRVATGAVVGEGARHAEPAPRRRPGRAGGREGGRRRARGVGTPGPPRPTGRRAWRPPRPPWSSGARGPVSARPPRTTSSVPSAATDARTSPAAISRPSSTTSG